MSSDSKVPTRAGESAIGRTGNADEAATLIRGTLGELERMLEARNVVGEPIQVDGATMLPLVNLGFAFGAGAGGGGGRSASGERGEGGGGGGGGGGGVKPVAVLVVQDGRVTLEPIPEPPSGLDKLGGAVADALDRYGKTSTSTDDD